MHTVVSSSPKVGLSRRQALASAVGWGSVGLLLACGPQARQAGRGTERAPVELYMTTWTNIANMPAWNQAVDEFNARMASRKLSVRMEHIPDGYWDKLKAAYAAGSAPDIVYASPADAQEVALQGVLLDLMPTVKAEKFNLDDINPPAQRPYMWDGKVFGIACWNDTRYLIYNKSLLQQAGFTELPREVTGTFPMDLFLRIAATLTDAEQGRWGYVPEGTGLRWMWLFGGEYWNNPQVPTRSAFDTPDSVAGLQFLYDLVYRYRVAPTPAQITAAGGPDRMFQQGKAAMIWGGYKSSTAIHKPITEFEWSITVFPRAKRSISNVSPQAFCAVSTTKHPQEAWVLIQDFSAGEGNIILTGTASMPCNKKIDIYKVSPLPAWQTRLIWEYMLQGQPEVPHPNVKNEMLRAMYDEAGQLLADKKSAMAAAKDGAERVNKIFEQYGIRP